jgi:hypothetical protein
MLVDCGSYLIICSPLLLLFSVAIMSSNASDEKRNSELVLAIQRIMEKNGWSADVLEHGTDQGYGAGEQILRYS